MNAISTLFTEVYLLKPEVHFDKRGSFKEYFVYQNFAQGQISGAFGTHVSNWATGGNLRKCPFR